MQVCINASCCIVYLTSSWIDAIPVFSKKKMRTKEKIWTITNLDNAGL